MAAARKQKDVDMWCMTLVLREQVIPVSQKVLAI